MSKFIIFCADGTWNGPGQPESAREGDDSTNVLKAYRMLRGAPTSPDSDYASEQEKTLSDGQDRAVQVTRQGLLDKTKLDLIDKASAYAWGCAAWRAHRAATCGDEGFLQKLAEDVPTLNAVLATPLESAAYVEAPIEAIAVWDTVGSLGIPDVRNGVNRDLFNFVDKRLAPTVAHGFHAVSADERRANFTPTLWDAAPRVLQAIFPGAHADVGGGYTTKGNESGLSDGALRWITGRLQEIGVTFSPPPAEFRPDPAGVAHAPWDEFPWDKLGTQARNLPPGLALAGSVVDRLTLPAVLDRPGAVPAPYAPIALGAYVTGRKPIAGVPIVLN